MNSQWKYKIRVLPAFILALSCLITCTACSQHQVQSEAQTEYTDTDGDTVYSSVWGCDYIKGENNKHYVVSINDNGELVKGPEYQEFTDNKRVLNVDKCTITETDDTLSIQVENQPENEQLTYQVGITFMLESNNAMTMGRYVYDDSENPNMNSTIPYKCFPLKFNMETLAQNMVKYFKENYAETDITPYDKISVIAMTVYYGNGEDDAFKDDGGIYHELNYTIDIPKQ